MWDFCGFLVTQLIVNRIKLEEFWNIVQETNESRQTKATTTVGMSQMTQIYYVLYHLAQWSSCSQPLQ